MQFKLVTTPEETALTDTVSANGDKDIDNISNAMEMVEERVSSQWNVEKPWMIHYILLKEWSLKRLCFPIFF